MALSFGSKPRRPLHADLFWSTGRSDRYRVCASLVQLAGRVVILTRTALDATRVAGELSRHGVPAASVDHRDFDAAYIRAQVVSDETLVSCPRGAARCVVHFDPAGGPRRYRRRVELLAAPGAAVVTLVVPDRESEARTLLADLDLPDVITGVELAVAERALELAAAAPASADPSDAALARSRRAVGSVVGQVRRSVFGAGTRMAQLPGTVLGSARGDETAFHGEQRAG